MFSIVSDMLLATLFQPSCVTRAYEDVEVVAIVAFAESFAHTAEQLSTPKRVHDRLRHFDFEQESAIIALVTSAYVSGRYEVVVVDGSRSNRPKRNRNQSDRLVLFQFLDRLVHRSLRSACIQSAFSVVSSQSRKSSRWSTGHWKLRWGSCCCNSASIRLCEIPPQRLPSCHSWSIWATCLSPLPLTFLIFTWNFISRFRSSPSLSKSTLEVSPGFFEPQTPMFI